MVCPLPPLLSGVPPPPPALLRLQDIDQNKIIQVYTELRQEANNGGVVVAVRHIESMIRMAEASARMHLRNHVSNDDVDLAISVLLQVRPRPDLAPSRLPSRLPSRHPSRPDLR